MAGTPRRQFLKQSAGATAGMTSWLALGKAPALAQKRELTFLSWNHFVPASDDELRRQAEVFGKQAGVTVRVDTIAHLQLPAKRAAEAQAQSGHDLVFVADRSEERRVGKEGRARWAASHEKTKKEAVTPRTGSCT